MKNQQNHPSITKDQKAEDKHIILLAKVAVTMAITPTTSLLSKPPGNSSMNWRKKKRKEKFKKKKKKKRKKERKKERKKKSRRGILSTLFFKKKKKKKGKKERKRGSIKVHVRMNNQC